MLELATLVALLAIPWFAAIVAWFEGGEGNRVIPAALTWIIAQALVCFLIIGGAVFLGLIKQLG